LVGDAEKADIKCSTWKCGTKLQG